mgnify:CR=1 FL=1
MRNAFWVLSLGLIAAYGFFFALGAFLQLWLGAPFYDLSRTPFPAAGCPRA